MRHFRLRWRALAHALLLSAGTFLISGAALAGVNGFVVVNPIVVCDNTGANCATFGAQCSTNITTGVYSCTTFNTPSTATLSTPIGFVDGDTNFNLTRAIMAAQANIDVAFFPVTQYNSPTNADPWTSISPTYSNTTYQHLHIKSITCKDGTVVSASPELAALTQQKICTNNKGTPSGVTNPPTAPSPAPPLASTLGESNALDVFFVLDYPGQAVFGQSWINGDGVSIGGNATFTSPSTGPGPRFDVLAHEIGHALDLDHTTFGAGGTNNLMTTGANRAVASTSGCSMQNPYGANSYQNTNFGVLYDLGDVIDIRKNLDLSIDTNPRSRSADHRVGLHRSLWLRQSGRCAVAKPLYKQDPGKYSRRRRRRTNRACQSSYDHHQQFFQRRGAG